MITQSQPELLEKLLMVQPGANLFGGGIWNSRNDLNWAFQQIRDFGKPAADEERYDREAKRMLHKYIPSLPPKEAGMLVQEIHRLTHACVSEMMAQQGYSMTKARKAIFAMIKTKIGNPDR